MTALEAQPIEDAVADLDWMTAGLIDQFEQAMVRIFRRTYEATVARMRANAGPRPPEDHPTTAVVAAAGDDLVPMTPDVFDEDAFKRAVAEEGGPVIERAIMSGAQNALTGYGFQVSDPAMAAAVGEHVAAMQQWDAPFRQHVTDTMTTAMEQGLSVKDAAASLREGPGAPLSEARATSIARTELIAASNRGLLDGARLIGANKKMWYATLDGRTRLTHAHAHGQEVMIDADFVVGGARLRFPGDPLAPTEERINCRCTLIFDNTGQPTALFDQTVQFEPLTTSFIPDIDSQGGWRINPNASERAAALWSQNIDDMRDIRQITANVRAGIDPFTNVVLEEAQLARSLTALNPETRQYELVMTEDQYKTALYDAARTLNGMLDRAVKTDQPFYRGMRVDDLDQFRKGSILDPQTMTSWVPDKNDANYILNAEDGYRAGQYKVIVQMQRGAEMVDLSDLQSGISLDSEERIYRGALEVVKTEKKGDITWVTVRAVAEAAPSATVPFSGPTISPAHLPPAESTQPIHREFPFVHPDQPAAPLTKEQIARIARGEIGVLRPDRGPSQTPMTAEVFGITGTDASQMLTTARGDRYDEHAVAEWSYNSGHFSTLLREGQPDPTGTDAGLRSMLAPVPNDMTTYRVVPQSAAFPDGLPQVGDTISDKAWTTSGLDRTETEAQFGDWSNDPVFLEIRTPAGSQGVYLGGLEYSDPTVTRPRPEDADFVREQTFNEFLLPPNTKLQVMSVDGNRVVAQVIPDPAIAEWNARWADASTNPTKIANDLLAVRPALNAEVQQGLGEWVANETNVNGWLRNDEPARGGESVKEAIEAASAPTPKDMIVYRAVPPVAFPGGAPQVGQTVSDAGFSTSSPDRAFVADTFGPQGTLGEPDNYIMHIGVPKGTYGTWADDLPLLDPDSELSGYPEFIMETNQRLKITRVEGQDVYAEAILDYPVKPDFFERADAEARSSALGDPLFVSWMKSKGIAESEVGDWESLYQNFREDPSAPKPEFKPLPPEIEELDLPIIGPEGLTPLDDDAFVAWIAAEGIAYPHDADQWSELYDHYVSDVLPESEPGLTPTATLAPPTPPAPATVAPPPEPQYEAFVEVPKQEREREIAAVLAAHGIDTSLPDFRTIVGDVLPPDTYAVYKAGQTNVLFSGYPPGNANDQRRILQYTADLQNFAPLQNPTIRIADTALKIDYYQKGDQVVSLLNAPMTNAIGMTWSGGDTVTLNPRLFERPPVMNTTPGFYPASHTVANHTEFVLAHEWGHTIHDSVHDAAAVDAVLYPGGFRSSPSLKVNVARDGAPDPVMWKDVSGYGKAGDKREMYADAFADWYMTKGSTKNKFTRALAEQEGWTPDGAPTPAEPGRQKSTSAGVSYRTVDANDIFGVDFDELDSVVGQRFTDLGPTAGDSEGNVIVELEGTLTPGATIEIVSVSEPEVIKLPAGEHPEVEQAGYDAIRTVHARVVPPPSETINTADPETNQIAQRVELVRQHVADLEARLVDKAEAQRGAATPIGLLAGDAAYDAMKATSPFLDKDRNELSARASTLPTDQQYAVDRYVGVGFQDFNRPLRRGQKITDQDTQKLIANLDGAIAHGTTPAMVTWRGVDSGRVFGMDPEFNDMRSLIGKRFTEPGYMSTTLDRLEAEQFATQGRTARVPVVMELEIPDGEHGLLLPASEQEVLLRRGVTFEVTGVEKVQRTSERTGQDFDEMVMHVRVLPVPESKGLFGRFRRAPSADLPSASPIGPVPPTFGVTGPKAGDVLNKARRPLGKVGSVDQYESAMLWGYASADMSDEMRHDRPPSERSQVVDTGLRTMIHTVPEDMTTWRAVPESAAFPNGLPKVGDVISDKAWTTSALNRNDVEEIFATWSEDPVRLEIRTPAGANGVYLGQIAAGEGDSFEEFLLPPDTKLRVLDVTPRNGSEGPRIILEALPETTQTATFPAPEAAPTGPKRDPENSSFLLPPPVTPQVQKREADAITEYTGGLSGSQVGGYANLNSVAREGSPKYPDAWNDDAGTKLIAGLDSAIDRSVLAEPVTVYRGAVAQPGSTWLDDLQPGAVVADPGFMSTSTSKIRAKKYEEALNPGDTSVFMQIRLAPGHRVLDVGGHDQEVVLPRGTTLKVAERRTRGAVTTIVMDVVDTPRPRSAPDDGPSMTPIGPPPKPKDVIIPGVGSVQKFLEKRPRKADEQLFEWQSRIVASLPQDVRHAVLFQAREVYQPVDYIRAGAEKWRRDHGLPEPEVDPINVPAPLAKAQVVAEKFEKTPDQSNDPRVVAAYADFKRQSAEMWDFMTKPEDQGGLGIRVTFAPYSAGDPYRSAEEQAIDLRDNHHITIQSGLGGEHAATMTTQEYDRFRAVHDVFGHASIGAGFDRHGEYETYLVHRSMYSGAGALAMATEYHGSNTALWGGEPGTPGTGKSILFPQSLIPNPWDDQGKLVKARMRWTRACTFALKPEPFINGPEADPLALAALIDLLNLPPDFAASFDASPWHSDPGLPTTAGAPNA